MLTIRANKKAVDFIRAKAAVRPEDFGRLPREIRIRAFTTAASEDLGTLRRILDALEDLPAGADWRQARREVAGLLADPAKGAGKRERARAKLIVHTAGRQAYAAARWREMQAQADVFPYLKYVADGDERTRPSHMALNGTVARIDDPFWQTHYPPWDFGCRCTAVPLTEAEAQEAGIADPEKLPQQPAENYRFDPTDINRDPDELADSYGNEWPTMCDAMRAIEVSERAAGLGGSAEERGKELARTVTAWDWFYQDFARKDGAAAAVVAVRDGREAIFLRREDTGARVAEALGGADSVTVPPGALALAGAGVRISSEHGHPGGTVFPSRADMMVAWRLGGLAGVNTQAGRIAYRILDRSAAFGKKLERFAGRKWGAKTYLEWVDFLRKSERAGKLQVTWEVRDAKG